MSRRHGPPVRQFIYDVYISNPVAHAVYGALLAEIVKELFDSIKELRRRPRIKIRIYGPDDKVVLERTIDKQKGP